MSAMQAESARIPYQNEKYIVPKWNDKYLPK